ncbi:MULTISPECIES: hypothetical protein [Roseateles]|uniref:Uncharacterized protein n=1 Tax=Pelomonas aquatica TaxID=431058 RepID=A0ABU1ZDV1_9BURK|nr:MULTISPECIES: hypothetical protein [Roseateles]KQY85605.1 hypothetical protein ASD35_23675 [Pelomonas sp. Root1444]MDR7298807.1 hypothetical protein [Pelomonas aquatica]
MTDRPTLLDHVAFFETEPEWVHPDGWHYGARFSTRRGDDRVIATVAPDEGEFSFEWWQGELLRARLHCVRVNRWEIVSTGATELLRVGFSDESVRSCELQLKPHVRVEWGMAWA